MWPNGTQHEVGCAFMSTKRCREGEPERRGARADGSGDECGGGGGGVVRLLGRALVVEVINSKTPTSFNDLLYLKLYRRGGSFSIRSQKMFGKLSSVFKYHSIKFRKLDDLDVMVP